MRESRTAQTSLFGVFSRHKFGDFLSDLSARLDAHPEVLVTLETDFLVGAARATGRKGLSVESIFRCMLLKQITGVSYEMLAFHLADSSSYRSFTRLQRDCYPGKSALSGNIRRIRPETLQRVFEQLGVDAFEQGVLEVTCLRVDSSVVKSNIAPPSHSRLLDDGIRVLNRLFAKSRDGTGVKLRLTDYRKQSKQLAAWIFYGKKSQKAVLYRELIPLAKRVVKQSECAIDQVQQRCGQSELSQPWIDQVTHYRQLLEQVIDQTERRVLNGENVPASEKLVSLFEPHTDIIIKGAREVESGHKINLATDKVVVVEAQYLQRTCEFGNAISHFGPIVAGIPIAKAFTSGIAAGGPLDHILH